MPRHAKPTPPPRRSPRVALAGAAVAAAVLFGGSATAAAIVPAGVEEETTLLECKTIEKPGSSTSSSTHVQDKPSVTPSKPSPAPGKPPLDAAPSTTAPAETPTGPTTPATQGEGTTAAEKLGWGTPDPAGSDEFDGTTVDTAKWVLPDGCMAGHAGNGQRCADNVTVSDGVLTLTTEPNGDTGWMQSTHNSYQGRWETRMRVADTPDRTASAHPVVLLWPVAEDFPVGGEVDYAETTATSDDISFFLHYGADNSQTGGGDEHGGKQAVDLTEWHNYAVEWDSDGITGYIDGEIWFEDTNSDHLPPREMKASLQADYFPGDGPDGTTHMEVEFHRFYPLPG